LFTNKKIKELFGYILIAAFNYPILFGLMFMFKNYFLLKDQLCFFFSYLIAYLIAYILQTKLFKSGHKNRIAVKYLLQIVIFFSIGNLLFFIFNGKMDINYLWSTLAVICLLFPLRFLFSKFVVFK